MVKSHMKRYEEIYHTADVAIKAYGRNLKELFSNAAFGMFEIIADLDGLKKAITIDIKLTEDSTEELLVSWLDELLYNFYKKGIIFFDFDVADMSENKIFAHAHGRYLRENRNRLKTEIKAVTYHNLNVKKTNEIYSVEIVFDV